MKAQAACACWSAATLLAAWAVAADSSAAVLNAPPANSPITFGKLTSWLGRAGEARVPREFREIDRLPRRALVPPALRRQGWQGRTAITFEWRSNPLLLTDDTRTAAAGVLTGGLHYAVRRPRFSADFDGSVEALEGPQDRIKATTLDTATFSTELQGQVNPRNYWDYYGAALLTHSGAGLVPSLNAGTLFETNLQDHTLSYGWRATPTLNLFLVARTTDAQSGEPGFVRTATTAATLGVAWRPTAVQRYTVRLRERQARFHGTPSEETSSVVLEWARQWSQTLVSELAIGGVTKAAGTNPGFIHAALTQSVRNGLWKLEFDRDTDAPGGVGRLIEVRRIRFLAEWRVFQRSRLTVLLDGAQYVSGLGFGAIRLPFRV